jgi:hypothetical protein
LSEVGSRYFGGGVGHSVHGDVWRKTKLAQLIIHLPLILLEGSAKDSEADFNEIGLRFKRCTGCDPSALTAAM